MSKIETNPSTSQQSDPPNNEQHNGVNSIQIKVPPFWLERPEIWFAQLEAQFQSAKIVSDRQKYNVLLGHIDGKILAQVADAVLNPPEADKYKNLKDNLMRCFSDSEQKKLKKLISEMSLGDRKPSQLLVEMRALAGTSVTDDFLKTLWLQRLPTQVQAILSANDMDTTDLAALADKITEVVDVKNLSAMNTKTSPKFEELAALTCKIEELTKRFDRFNGTNTRSRSRSKSRNRNEKTKHDRCWYHWKFGDKAEKCTPPCSSNKKTKN